MTSNVCSRRSPPMPILSALHLYPIKSCAGITLQEATITGAGLMSAHIYDREWMVVDMHGEFLTQRDYPRMALIQPRLRLDTLELRAPGMLRLELPLDLPAPERLPATMKVRVWSAALPMVRFRPNIVIDDSDAFEYDHAGLILIGQASIRPCKPCPRCTIPS